MLPFIVHFKVARPGHKSFGFWFPIILIWILLAALLLVLLPFFLLAAILGTFWSRSLAPWKMLLIYPLLWTVLGNLSGLHIETKSAENDLLIDFQ